LGILNNESVEFAIFLRKVFKKLSFRDLSAFRFREWAQFEKGADSFTFSLSVKVSFRSIGPLSTFLCCLVPFFISSCNSLKDKNGPSESKDRAVFWTDGVQENSAEARAIRGNSFLKRNALVEGVRSHRSGMQSLVVKGGNGPFPGMNDIVTVKYRLVTIDGTLLDDGDGPAQFRMTDVIDGWKEALVKMRVGSEWRLFVPPHLAYGDDGLAQVPGGQTLIYDLKLIGVKEDSKVTEGRRLRLLKRIKANKIRSSSEEGPGTGQGLLLDNLDLIE